MLGTGLNVVGMQSSDDTKMRLDATPNLQPKTTSEAKARKTKDAMDQQHCELLVGLHNIKQ